METCKDMSKTIIYQAQPGMQEKFLSCAATEIGYFGMAGGGKSLAMLMGASRWLNEPNYRAIIFRKSYPDLQHLVTEARQMYTPMGGKYNASEHTFRWKNDAAIMFRHLSTESDVYNYQGQEYDYIGFDELGQFPEHMYLYLFSRLRGKNPKIKRQIVSSGNPEGKHIGWVKDRWPDQLTPLETGYFTNIEGKNIRVDKGTPESVSRAYIPCIRAENKILMNADPNYEAMLSQLTGARLQALKYGKWMTSDQPDQLISYGSWEHALSGNVEYIDDGKWTIGADYATHQGSDKSVEIIGKGNRPYRCRWWSKTKTTHMSLKLAESAREVDPSLKNVMIGVDSIGPGTGVADDLETNHNMSYILERCTHKDPIYDAHHKGEIQFDNLRSQMCWQFKTDMDDGSIDLSQFAEPQKGTTNGYFEEFKLLQTEVFAHTYRVYNGKLIVISKAELKKADKLGHSPDFSDALIIWNWVRHMHYQDAPLTDEEEFAKVDSYAKKMYDKENNWDDDRDSDYYDQEQIDDLDEDYDY